MSSHTHPLVSVIIPAYNYGHFIVETIESVLNQTYPNIEIIIIDDGSTDDTSLKIEYYHKKVRYHYKKNAGLSSARNTGMQLAKGEYLQFLDADDLLSETAIEHKVRFLQENPDVGFCYCKTECFREVNSVRKYYYKWGMPSQREQHRSLYYFNIAPPHAFLIRLIDVRNFNLSFDPELKACEDHDFWLRLALSRNAPQQILTTKVFYREHEGSMSKKLLQQYKHDAYVEQRNFDTLRMGFLIDKVSKAEALVLILAASLITYRRLYFLDKSFAFDFYASFIKKSLMPAILASDIQLSDLKTLHFRLTIIRQLMIKITVKDKSIDFRDFTLVFERLGIHKFLGLKNATNKNYTFAERYAFVRIDAIDLMRLFLYRSC